MGFKFNAITGNLDLVGGGGVAGYLPPVDSFVNLPVSAPDGTVVAVKDEATVYVYSEDSGLWVPQRGPKDIETTSAPISENAAIPTAITGFVLNNQVTTFESVLELTVDVGTLKRYSMHLYCVYDGVQWRTSKTYVGDLLMDFDPQVEYDGFGNPTLYYTSGTEVGFVSATIKFRAKSL